MTDFFAQYGLFLAKVVTVLVAAMAVIAFAAAASRRGVGAETLSVENLNDRFRRLGNTLRAAAFGKRARKALVRDEKARRKAESKTASERPRTYVIDFKGDIRASGSEALREEVTAILDVAREQDDVVVRLDNAGGIVHEHGLAASQLVRLRGRGIRLTVCVDKIAASGGYLMACVAHRIVAAPFAILGSIGVLAQLPNFNRMLDQHGVDFEQITAGRYKRSVTMFGKNTDEHRAKLREELEDIHELFKSIVHEYRPELDLESVATGEHWYGTRALDLRLADALMTSDELLTGLAAERDLYKVSYKIRHPLRKKLLGSAEALLGRLGFGV